MQKKGISLIVLVITIIVMIILAATVVFSLNNTNIINKSNVAVNNIDLKNIQTIVSLAWGDAYAGGARTQTELEKAVFESLNGMDISKYDINVTNKGVTVSIKEKTNWPITWNTIDVMNNYSIMIGEMPFVKIRDFIPTIEDFNDLSIMIPKIVIDDEIVSNKEILTYTTHEEIENIIIFSSGDNVVSYVLVVLEAGRCETLNIEFEETGIYVLNFGVMGVDVEFTIGQMVPMPEIAIENNILSISAEPNTEMYEIYINNTLISTTKEKIVDLTQWLPENKNALIYVRGIAKNGYNNSKYACCVNLVNMIMPGLYESGSANLYYTSGEDAIKDKLIKTWPQLVAEGYINADGSANENLEPQGDLILTYGIEEIKSEAFYDIVNLTGVYIAEGCTTIAEQAFYSCDNLATIIIPESVKKIESQAFGWSRNLISVKFVGNSQLESIGERAFLLCEALTDFTLPVTVKEIGENAFQDAKIKTIKIPAGLTKMGNAVFAGCYNLTEVSVEENNPTYYCKGNCIIEKATKKIVQGFINSVIPSDGSVTAIGDYAFYHMFRLNKSYNIVIPDTITHIGAWSFYNCTYLSNIKIPQNVVYIGEYAFGNVKLSKATFDNPNGWYCINKDDTNSKVEISASDLNNISTAAQYLSKTYYSRNWYRN